MDATQFGFMHNLPDKKTCPKGHTPMWGGSCFWTFGDPFCLWVSQNSPNIGSVGGEKPAHGHVLGAEWPGATTGTAAARAAGGPAERKRTRRRWFFFCQLPPNGWLGLVVWIGGLDLDWWFESGFEAHLSEDVCV